MKEHTYRHSEKYDICMHSSAGMRICRLRTGALLNLVETEECRSTAGISNEDKIRCTSDEEAGADAGIPLKWFYIAKGSEVQGRESGEPDTFIAWWLVPETGR